MRFLPQVGSAKVQPCYNKTVKLCLVVMFIPPPDSAFAAFDPPRYFPLDIYKVFGKLMRLF